FVLCPLLPRAPRSTLFPYTTLFRSGLEVALEAARVGGRRRVGEFGQRPHLVRQRVEEEFYDADRRLIVEDGDQDDLARRCRERRSEEHTSELQSRENLVCRLLLEKK